MINNNSDKKDKFIIVSMGSRGLIYCRHVDDNKIYDSDRIKFTDKDLNISNSTNICCEYFPAMYVPISDIVDSNGVGDEFCAGFISNLFHELSNNNNSNIYDIMNNNKSIESGMLAAINKLCNIK
jgi:sugar/nucleoside kinase (ribokinase family)